MWSNLRRWLPWVAVVAVVLVIVFVIGPLFSTQRPDNKTTKSATHDSSQSAPVSKSSQPSSKPSQSPKTGETQDENTRLISCESLLGNQKYNALLTSIEQYEVLYQEDASMDSLKGVATNSYIKFHASSATPDPYAVTVNLDSAKSTVSCTANDPSRLVVVIRAVITTSRNGETVNGPFTVSHSSTWVRQGGQWLVDTEQEEY